MAEKKVLLVEDDQIISTMYQTKLKQAGYLVLLANNGADGINLALSEKPDIILLDVILPQVDGFSVLEEIRKSHDLKSTPVIMLTNLGTEEDKEKGKKLGATDYIFKANLTPAQMLEVIKNY